MPLELTVDDFDEAPADDGRPPLEIVEVAQNTEDWLAERTGIATASAFDKIVSGGRADRPSQTRQRYLYQLVAERLTGQPSVNFSTRHTERGHADEDKAAVDYAFQRDVRIETIGFMRRGQVGFSPDRIVVDQPGYVEVKSRLPDLQLQLLDDGIVPDEHWPQLQGGLWISSYEWVDFVAYSDGLPLFVKRIEPDPKYIEWLSSEVERFCDELDAAEARFRKQYYGA